MTSLSFSVSKLSGVGHSLDAARALNKQVSEVTARLKAVGEDVDGLSHEVEDCITRGHYQSTRLGKLAQSLQDLKGAVMRSANERQRVIAASYEFHQNVKNVS